MTSNWIFNAIDFGAVADGETDNTAAFSRCINAILEAGGGRMFLPAGRYRGNIVIPSYDAPGWITVEIVGEGQPTPIFGTVSSIALSDRGTIVKGLCGEDGAVIRAMPNPDSQYCDLSMLCVVVRELEVRTSDDPKMHGIDLEYVQQCRIENVVVNTDVYSVQASKPTHGTSGIITPACNNAALTILRNVVVTGYHTGIVVNEHTDGDCINLACCVNGLEFVFAHHASRFGRVGAQRCTNNITVSGKHGFSIQQLDMEVSGAGQHDGHNDWQCTEYNLNDPENLGIGDLKYWVVEGNVGAVETFARCGGEGISAKRIGCST